MLTSRLFIVCFADNKRANEDDEQKCREKVSREDSIFRIMYITIEMQNSRECNWKTKLVVYFVLHMHKYEYKRKYFYIVKTQV